MKKNLAALVLVISITGNLYGQKKGAAGIFELPPDKISRIFFIDLGKGNKMKLELEDLHNLETMANIDSILHEFLEDIEPLKDSLANELVSKRIDYIIDATGKNKIRVQQFTTIGSSYLVNHGDIAALKLEQDTINIISKTIDNTGKTSKKNSQHFHYYRISFFLNNLNDLTKYMDGKLQDRISDVRKNAANKWVNGKDGMMHLKSNPVISSNTARGLVAGGSDYLNLKLTSDIQNYKNYFIPSLSLGFAIVATRNSIKREFSLMNESHFSFAKNDQGNLQTFRNTFLTIAYSQDNTIKEKSTLGFSPAFSLGYLIRQRGNIYDKNTFRLGFGRATLFGERIKIEPVIYFHNLFKGITPGIRLSL